MGGALCAHPRASRSNSRRAGLAAFGNAALHQRRDRARSRRAGGHSARPRTRPVAGYRGRRRGGRACPGSRPVNYSRADRRGAGAGSTPWACAAVAERRGGRAVRPHPPGAPALAITAISIVPERREGPSPWRPAPTDAGPAQAAASEASAPSLAATTDDIVRILPSIGREQLTWRPTARRWCAAVVELGGAGVGNRPPAASGDVA